MSWGWLKSFWRASPQQVPPEAPSIETESWQERVRRVQLPKGERVSVTGLATGNRAASRQVLREDIRASLAQDGLAYDTSDAIDFVEAALFGSGEWPRGVDLRRHGTLLTKSELKQLGYRANLILTSECLAILTDKGRERPTDSSQFIVSSLMLRTSNRAHIARAKSGGLSLAQVIPNSTASGPCAACMEISSRLIPIEKAPIGPLPSCPHPSQCVLHIRATVDWLDI